MAPVLDALVAFREQVREAATGSIANISSLLAACDVLRDETLVRCGVRLEDRSAQNLSALWSLHPPAELIAEVRWLLDFV